MNVADINSPLSMRVVVVDTGPLLNDVLRRARQSHATSLVQAARSPSMRFLAPAHVRIELEQHLPRRGTERAIAPDHLAALWIGEYLPVIRFVDVPVDVESTIAGAVAARDLSDLPTALLAQLVAADAVLAEDQDLIATGFAAAGWLETVLALRDAAAFQAGLVSVSFGSTLLAMGAFATMQATVRHPRIGLLCGLLGAGLVGLAGRRGWYPSARTLSNVGTDVGRMLADAFESYTWAEAVLGRWSPPTESVDPHLAKVARAVARAPDPVSVAAIQRMTDLPLALVRGALDSPLFARQARGWTLGRVVGGPPEGP